MTNRLLSLNTYFYRRGGSEAVFFDHDELFRNLGWETAMFAMKHPQNFESPWSEYFVDELEFGGDYGAAAKLKMAGKVIWSTEARDKLGRLLDRFTPDIAHGHLLYHHLSPSVMALLKDRGVPTVMTAHDLKVACPAYTMFNSGGVCEKCINGNLLHVVSNRCVRGSLSASVLVAVESAIHKSLKLWRKNLDRIVTPSRFYRDKLMEWGWPEEKLVYIPNYIDATLFRAELRARRLFPVLRAIDDAERRGDSDSSRQAIRLPAADSRDRARRSGTKKSCGRFESRRVSRISHRQRTH